MNKLKRNYYGPILVGIAALYTIFTILRIGNPDVRVANAISDDHPSVYAQYFKFPDKWSGDIVQTTGLAYLRSSIQNWSTAYLYRDFSISPAALSFLFVWIQNAGLALALLLYCRFLSASPLVACIVMAATFASQPWASNLAYYPNVMHSPYPGHLAVPFLIFAAVAFLNEHWRSLTLWLAIGALTHPTHAIHLMLILFLSLCFDPSYKKFRIKLTVLFAGLSAFAAFPPLLLVPKGENPLTNAEVMPVLLASLHLTPWNNEVFWTWAIPTITGIFLLAYFAITQMRELNPKLKFFYWANFSSVVIAAIVQWVGVYGKIPALILFCPLRVSVLNALFMMPLAFLWVLEGLKDSRWVVKLSSVLLVSFQIISTTGFFWGQALPLIFAKRLKNERGGKQGSQVLHVVFFLTWFGIFFFCGRPLRWLGLGSYTATLRYLLAPAGRFEIQSLLLLGALSAILLFLSRRWTLKIMQLGLLASIFLLTTLQTYHQGKETTRGVLYSRYEMQKWAKENTAADSVFIMQAQPWRGISERRVSYADYSPSLPAYFRFRELKERNAEVTKFYVETGKTSFETLSENELTNFQSRFGGDYVLRAPNAPKLFFPLVFHNALGSVYQLPTSGALSQLNRGHFRVK